MSAQVLCLKNMVTPSELEDDMEYEDIKADVRQECSQSGIVEDIVIPRRKDGYSSAIEGSIYVLFREVSMAQACRNSLAGRKFADQTVNAEFVSSSITGSMSMSVFVFVLTVIFSIALV